MIQRCFDDNKDDDKGDDKKLKEWVQEVQERIKNTSRFKRKVDLRIKIQGSSFQESRLRFKTQDSRIKRKLNQDKY